MTSIRPNLARALAVLLLASTGAVLAQVYPSKPVRIITAEAGGGADIVARVIAQGLTETLGQPVIIENRGGSVAIAGALFAKSPADGYTLLLYSNTIWLLPMLQDNVPYDPIKDFAPVSLTNIAPNILVVHPSVPVKSVRELVKLAKSRPGDLNYSSGPTGSPNHLGAELFKAMAGVKIIRVPYKGTGPALNALIGGEVNIMFSTTAAVTPHIAAKRLRGLAVTSLKPTSLAAGLPSIAEAGVPGYESISYYGLFAPGGTPAAYVERVSTDTAAVLNRERVRERFLGNGVESVGSTPAQFAATLQSEIQKWGKLIREAGIRD